MTVSLDSRISCPLDRAEMRALMPPTGPCSGCADVRTAVLGLRITRGNDVDIFMDSMANWLRMSERDATRNTPAAACDA
jgi:hypothetical protein